MHFSVAGQCIGSDSPVSALFFFLRGQLEQPAVTRILQKRVGVAQSGAAGSSQPRSVFSRCSCRPVPFWAISQAFLFWATQLRSALGPWVSGEVRCSSAGCWRRLRQPGCAGLGRGSLRRLPCPGSSPPGRSEVLWCST